MTVSETLERAAEILEHDGWCQGRYVSEDGSRCLMGALWRAAYDGGGAYTLPEEESLRKFLGVGYRRLSQWNDAPGRTAKEVVAALRACARKEKNR